MTGLPPHEERRLLAVASDPEEFDSLRRRRLAGWPLQYLEGTAAFGPFDVTVDERVLVPRPETEGLWQVAVAATRSPETIVDLCTGSGALAIALAHSFPDARVVGTDVSAAALEVAALNGARLAPGVEWFEGDLFDALPPTMAGSVDLLVTNPPYVAESEWEALPADVKAEPRRALVAGPTGLEVYRRITAEVGEWMSAEGVIVGEFGETQGEAIATMFAPLGSVEISVDLAGRDRYVVCRR